MLRILDLHWESPGLCFRAPTKSEGIWKLRNSILDFGCCLISGRWSPLYWILAVEGVRSKKAAMSKTFHCAGLLAWMQSSGFRILDLRVLGHFSLVRQAPPPHPPPTRPLPEGLGSWILDLEAKIYQKRQIFFRSKIQDPRSKIQDLPGERVGGGDLGSWILDLGSSADSTKEGKYCENPESKIRSRSPHWPAKLCKFPSKKIA